jgi:hypothetical protein
MTEEEEELFIFNDTIVETLSLDSKLGNTIPGLQTTPNAHIGSK